MWSCGLLWRGHSMCKLVPPLPAVAKLSNSPGFPRRLLGLSDKMMFIKHSLKGQTCMKVFRLQFSLYFILEFSSSCPYWIEGFKWSSLCWTKCSPVRTDVLSVASSWEHEQVLSFIWTLDSCQQQQRPCIEPQCFQSQLLAKLRGNLS